MRLGGGNPIKTRWMTTVPDFATQVPKKALHGSNSASFDFLHMSPIICSKTRTGKQAMNRFTTTKSRRPRRPRTQASISACQTLISTCSTVTRCRCAAPIRRACGIRAGRAWRCSSCRAASETKRRADATLSRPGLSAFHEPFRESGPLGQWGTVSGCRWSDRRPRGEGSPAALVGQSCRFAHYSAAPRAQRSRRPATPDPGVPDLNGHHKAPPRCMVPWDGCVSVGTPRRRWRWSGR